MLLIPMSVVIKQPVLFSRHRMNIGGAFPLYTVDLSRDHMKKAEVYI